MKKTLVAVALTFVLALAAGVAAAVPLLPRDDAEVVETLPAAGTRGEDGRLRRELAARPGDAVLAVRVARRQLERARAEGDPREAGLALAALKAWPDAATAPIDVLLLQATLDQYLHDFDAAVVKLERLVAREPRHAQAWLTLATIRRVQGRYADSDVACRRIAAAGAGLHATACLAENESLRGRFDEARARLQGLLATPGLDRATRAWLLTTRAELEARSGDAAAADVAWRAALQAAPNSYALIGRADELIANGRFAEALALLADAPRADAVVLRRAIAATRLGAPLDDVREMRERIALANERPEAAASHGREQAMFALWVEREPALALMLARENVRHQREPVDLLVLAQAAKASGDAEAQKQARRLVREIGLVDRRVEGLW